MLAIPCPATYRLIPFVLPIFLTMGMAATALGQTRSGVDLALVSLEDLMQIQITSASRKEQRVEEVPAPVYVITQDDIRRSGMTTVGELLRLVPGLQVAQINANKWAISARGFNTLFANKLLVLIDGRSVYDPLNSGQFIESEDLVLEDIDRIEVVRGPAGAVWGANAVNGVINILTKTAAETRGASVRVSAGTFERFQGSARYGGAIGAAQYRVFTQWSSHGESRLDSTTPAGDDWRATSSGLRVDWKKNRHAFLLESNFSTARLDPLWVGTPATDSAASDTQTANVLGRWTHTSDTGRVLQVQSFFDSRPRNDPSSQSRQKTTDFDVQYRAGLGRRHDVVVGTGARVTKEAFDGTFVLSVTPSESARTVVNVFAQDEIALVRDRIDLTLGSRLEHDTYSGWGVQPTARVLWHASPGQHVWAGVSRALRTPSLFDLGIRLNFLLAPGAPGDLPVLLSVLGNPEFRPERVLSTEAGYRVNIGTSASVDATAFVSRYRGLRASEPLPPRVELTPGPPHLLIATQYANLLEAETSGLEIDARWQPTAVWRLDGSYTGFRFTPHFEANTLDPDAAATDGNAPVHQWQIHSSLALGSRAQLDAALFHVGALRQLEVPSYNRADLRLETKVTRQLSVIVAGQNLFEPTHAEFGGANLAVQATRIPRSALIQLAWRY